MTQIATVLGHLHANGVVHGHVYPVSRPPLVIFKLFLLTHSLLKAVIRIKDDGNAMLTHTGAYTVASRVLHPYIQSFPNRESFAYSSPEFLKMDAPRVPTKAMDVYAFGSSLYTVRQHPESNLDRLGEADVTILEGPYRRRTVWWSAPPARSYYRRDRASRTSASSPAGRYRGRTLERHPKLLGI